MGFAERYGAGNTVEDRETELVGGESARSVMPARPRTIASAPVLQDCQPYLAAIPPRRRIALLEIENRYVRSPHPGAASREAVADEVVLDSRHRAGEGRDHRKLVREYCREMEPRLADADDRRRGQAAHRIEAGVVEASDHHAVDPLSLPHDLEHAGTRATRRNSPRCLPGPRGDWSRRSQCRAPPRRERLGRSSPSSRQLCWD